MGQGRVLRLSVSAPLRISAFLDRRIPALEPLMFVFQRVEGGVEKLGAGVEQLYDPVLFKSRMGLYSLNRHDYGVSWNPEMPRGGAVVGDLVEITIDAEAILES